MALSTVSAILKRIGLGKRSRLEPLEPPNRYECARPGELLHVDVKKLARFSRPGHRVLGRGRGRFETGAGYAHACLALGLRHTHTRPRRPRTNGEAERFIQTMLSEWAYARLYATSAERTDALTLWLSHYNYRRPHGSLNHRSPGWRLNNVARNYT
jgi:hypothetical protein